MDYLQRNLQDLATLIPKHYARRPFPSLHLQPSVLPQHHTLCLNPPPVPTQHRSHPQKDHSLHRGPRCHHSHYLVSFATSSHDSFYWVPHTFLTPDTLFASRYDSICLISSLFFSLTFQFTLDSPQLLSQSLNLLIPYLLPYCQASWYTKGADKLVRLHHTHTLNQCTSDGTNPPTHHNTPYLWSSPLQLSFADPSINPFTGPLINPFASPCITPRFHRTPPLDFFSIVYFFAIVYICIILYVHKQKKSEIQKYRVGTRKCVCTHAMSHSGVSVCIVKVIGGYGHGTQNCGCVAPLHGNGNPLQQVVVQQRLSSLHPKMLPQLLKEGQGSSQNAPAVSIATETKTWVDCRSAYSTYFLSTARSATAPASLVASIS